MDASPLKSLRTCLFVQGALILIVSVSLFWMDNSRKIEYYCTSGVHDPFTVVDLWFYTSEIVAFGVVALLISSISVLATFIGIKNERPTILRLVKPLILLSTIFSVLVLLRMEYSTGVFRGRQYSGGGYSNNGCPELSGKIDLVFFGFVALLVSFIPYVILLDSYIVGISEPIALKDFIKYVFNCCKNFIKYGRSGLSQTRVYNMLSHRVKKSFGVHIRVTQKSDTLFREISLGDRLFDVATLQELREKIGAKYNRRVEEIQRLTKNGKVLVDDDDDVRRLTKEDYIEVEFEENEQRLAEINSIILEDSIGEHKIDMNV